MRDPGRCSLFLFSHHKLYCKVDFESLMYPMSRLVFNEVVEEEHLPSWVALEEHPWVVLEASLCLEGIPGGAPIPGGPPIPPGGPPMLIGGPPIPPGGPPMLIGGIPIPGGPHDPGGGGMPGNLGGIGGPGMPV